MNKDKKLQKLKRVELLELLLSQSKDNEELRIQLEEKEKRISCLEEQLRNHKLDLKEAGTIAEASFKVNGVFESAEKAAKQYLDNLKLLYEKEEYLTSQKEIEVEKKCLDMVNNTRNQCEKLLRETEEKCRLLEEKTNENIEKRWSDLSKRIDCYLYENEVTSIKK